MELARLTKCLCTQRGLYILGAGASSPLVPLASMFGPEVGRLYLSGSSFPVNAPPRNILSNKIIRDALSKQEPRTVESELLAGMSTGYALDASRYLLARPAALNLHPDNYAVFSLFPASIIWNFNHDGLAERMCAPRHKIFNEHGVVHSAYGGDFGRESMKYAQEYDAAAKDAREVMFEPEPEAFYDRSIPDLDTCRFVAVIGYSFARTNNGFDDAASLYRLCEALRASPRPVVIIDPSPELTVELVREWIKSNRVYSYSLYWNVYARALSRAMMTPGEKRSIDAAYGFELDSVGPFV